MKNTKAEIFQDAERSLNVFVFVHAALILLLNRHICRFWEGSLVDVGFVSAVFYGAGKLV